MKKYLAAFGLNSNGISAVAFPVLAGDKTNQSFVEQIPDDFIWFDDLEEAKRYVQNHRNKTLFEVEIP